MASIPVTIRAKIKPDEPDSDPDVGTLVVVTPASAVSSGDNLPLATTDDVITVTPGVYEIQFLDGTTTEVTPTGHFTRDGVQISGTEDTIEYTVVLGDAGSVIGYVDFASGPNGQQESSQIDPITIATGTPATAPDAPTVGQWEFAASYYDPNSQTTDFRAQVTLLGTVASTAVDAQWTTDGEVPARSDRWETLELVSGATYKTVMLNPELGDFGVFTEAQARRSQFRIRYRTAAGGNWSLESDTKEVPLPGALALPGAPTSPLAVAETLDGEITVSATAPASWGDYTTGVIQWSVDGNNWATFTSPATVTLDSSNYGQSRVIQFRALSDEGVPGPSVSAAAITVPGEIVSAGVDLSLWYTFKFSNNVQIASPANKETYFWGYGGFEKQFLVGGDRSPVDPNVVGFAEDVTNVWITENAEDDYPYYRLGKSIGIGGRISIAMKFDPDTRGRFVYCQEGEGLFLTDDLGESYRRVLTVRNVPGGSSSKSGGRYRSYRHLFDYDPEDHTLWYFVNTAGSLYRSTNRGESWSAISSAPSSQNWDVCYYLKVDYGNSNTLWAVCWTGLYKSTNGGVTWAKQTPDGLPGGANPIFTGADFNPNDPDDFYVVQFDRGLYRTTNGGNTFSKVSTPHNAIANIAVSNVNRNHMWCMTPNRGYPSGNPGKKSIYSSNGGTSWQNVESFPDTYGWASITDGGMQDWSKPFRTVGYKAERNAVEQQSVIFPSPLVANKAIATTQVRMWRCNNGTDWYNASHGFDSIAFGEANTNSVNWSKSDENLSAWNFFDIGPRKSTNGLASFVGLNAIGYAGVFDVGGGSVAIHPTNPQRMLLTRGSYINPVTLIVSTNGGASNAGSFRPPQFVNNTIGSRIHWCDWHASGNSVAYCQKGKSTDYGANFTYWNNVGNLPLSFCGDGRRSGVHGMSPVNGNILYAFDDTCLKIKRSTNGGTTWSDIGGGANIGPGASRDQPYTFHVDPLDADVAYWWVKDEGLKKYDASTGNITTHATNFAGIEMGRVRVSPLNNDHIYVMADSFGPDGINAWVIRSINGAAGPFVNISANLPRTGANRSMEIEPHSGIVFVGGTAGTRMFGPPGGSARFTQLATDMKLQT